MSITQTTQTGPLTKYEAIEICSRPNVAGMSAVWKGEGREQTAEVFVLILTNGLLLEFVLQDTWDVTVRSSANPTKKAVEIKDEWEEKL